MPDSFINEIIDHYRGRGRDALLQILWEVQTKFGYIAPEAVHEISHVLKVPEAAIYGVISFYSLFHDQPTGERIVYVCTDPSCSIAGAEALLEDATRQSNNHSDRASGRRHTVLRTTCLGLCDCAPVALISQRGQGDRAFGPIGNALDLLEGEGKLFPVNIGGDVRILLDTAGAPQSLNSYGDYAALRQAVHSSTPDAVIKEVEASGLIGRGGAAFPTGTKWRGASQAPATPRYVVCNADESEPGTFKDRVLLENRPHLVLEGMALCAYAIGAEYGTVFIRGEYPESARMMESAIQDAVKAGLLGTSIMGSPFSFTVEVRRGAGAYICGEETALFEAIEGKRGFPRIKPPFPTTHGLFGKPTVINNVETLAAVPGVVQHGAAWFRQWGTEKSTGTKLVSVSGHVCNPGVYEIIPGITLREVLDRYCGGVVGSLKAILMGGASGTFLTPAEIDVRLTFEDLRAAGSTFGSGAIMVFNDTADLNDILRRLGRFFQHESCGKCFPCQLGTQRQMEILDRLEKPHPGDRQRLLDIGATMTEASLCGLGQTAASAVLSALKKFPEVVNV